MDLRDRNLTPEQIKDVEKFILKQKMAYQPFIFTDTLETGAGQKFHDGEGKGGRVYWENPPEDLPPAVRGILTDDPVHFRECNRVARCIYDYFVDSIVENLGDISKLSFAEVGCNTGYFLHALALRGAAKCIGFDFTPNADVFAWFNNVLNITNEFRFAEWDSLSHCLYHAEMPQVDVTLTVAVTCHIADPIHHLAYLCDHSKKAIFLWSPVNRDEGLSISYGKPNKYADYSLSWPVNIDNEVRPSIPMIRLGLQEAGFGDIREVKCPDNLSTRWKGWYMNQIGYIALRTQAVKTALAGGRFRRPVPPEISGPKPLLVEEGYKKHNVIKLGDKFYGLAQSEGKLDLDRVHTKGYRCVVGKSVEEVKQLIGRTSK